MNFSSQCSPRQMMRPGYDWVMGNLGQYQEIVELAKRSGGVDPMIEKIQRKAVTKAAPKVFFAGLAAGAVIVPVAQPVVGWVKGRLNVNVRRTTPIEDAAAIQGLEKIVQTEQDLAPNEEKSQAQDASVEESEFDDLMPRTKAEAKENDDVDKT
ncbi:hypothetical protein [Corynebacterium sp. TAE3-ERU16]|uniref:hypothetical protein n=1 Tax=Corynebacterium sp. TAE3-ERU16 TaxID=2849493 RepID=UPI001C443DE4|nr:hypothetical protein [Corynebacterium sp. TAE3-ERU16]MBV7292468.1 hypothetical protein [Corynebacterium sp. TAE3-ERU16]